VGCEWWYDDVAKRDDAEYDGSEYHAKPTRYASLP
jgi:hypothetical protein